MLPTAARARDLMPLPIEDYAVIGDCHTAALVGKDGSIDWLCFPRFDSGACFAALLGGPENGRWSIAPTATVRRVTRRYRDSGLVLETDIETDEGSVRLIDFMPLSDQRWDLVRIIEGFGGGGSPDLISRLMGQWLSDRLHQPFVVENRIGAGGNVGAVLAGFLFKGLGDTQQTLSMLGALVAVSALCAIAVRFSADKSDEAAFRVIAGTARQAGIEITD